MASKPGPKGPPVSEEFRKSIRQLKESKAQLDQADDALGALIPEIETLLRDLALGVMITTSVWEEEDGSAGVLAFEKWGGEWRLTYDEVGNWESDAKPVRDIGRDMRARTYEKLPALLMNAVKQVEEKVAERERTFETLVSMIDVLREEVTK